MTNEPRKLDEILAILREEHRQIEPPSSIENNLLTNFPSAPPSIRTRRWTWTLALASVLAALLLWANHHRRVNHQVQPMTSLPTAEIAQTSAASDFILLPSAETLPPPREVRIWRLRIAKGELAQYGFNVPPAVAGDLIYADFAVGEDGLPREIRLVR